MLYLVNVTEKEHHGVAQLSFKLLYLGDVWTSKSDVFENLEAIGKSEICRQIG